MTPDVLLVLGDDLGRGLTPLEAVCPYFVREFVLIS